MINVNNVETAKFRVSTILTANSNPSLGELSWVLYCNKWVLDVLQKEIDQITVLPSLLSKNENTRVFLNNLINYSAVNVYDKDFNFTITLEGKYLIAVD